MVKQRLLFFLLVCLCSLLYSEESKPVDCPMQRSEVERLNNKLNECLTELIRLRATLTAREKNSEALKQSLADYRSKLDDYEIYIKEARLLVESLQKSMKNLSGLYGQAMISIQKAQESLTALKADYEKLKKLYDDRLSSDIITTIVVGGICALAGFGIGILF